ncbi:MAG: hypothetical protein A2W33_07650 [Chloroflexi bacterium RBG_16_52_11]|nr:MAG: hypothetical protein A2W33_07650 [Chloroflexi bacterium RBG_16_52_11]
MRIAYIISAYKYPELLIRLITRLHSDSASFFVHVDKKTPLDVYAQMVNGTKHLSNVFFLKRHRCYWGDFGHVRATIEGINEIINRDTPFDYAVLLTGQDYPIKTNEHIQTFFRQSKGKSFMDYFPLPSDNWEGGGMQRLELWHVRLSNHHYAFPKNSNLLIKRKFPKGFQPFGGSSYWSLSRACIAYLYEFIKTNRRFINYFKYVDVPDELVFQTILLNSPFAESIVNDDLRYIEWKEWDAGSPAVLDKYDFDRLTRSSKLFARKFDLNVDAEVLDLIDQAIK